MLIFAVHKIGKHNWQQSVENSIFSLYNYVPTEKGKKKNSTGKNVDSVF